MTELAREEATGGCKRAWSASAPCDGGLSTRESSLPDEIVIPGGAAE